MCNRYLIVRRSVAVAGIWQTIDQLPYTSFLEVHERSILAMSIQDATALRLLRASSSMVSLQ